LEGSLSLSLSSKKEHAVMGHVHGFTVVKNQNWEVITKSKNPPTLVIYTYTNDK
jgi:hypothetical protein